MVTYACMQSSIRLFATSGINKLKFRNLEPVKVAITGARGNVGSSLAFRVALGDMLGVNQPVILQLYSRDVSNLDGLRMELEDTNCPLLKGIVTSNSYDDVFGDASYVCMVGSPPRSKGMERGDLLKISGEVFKTEGKVIGEVARRDCKIVVVGNPANTNAMIAAANSKHVPPENFSAMTRLDHNRAIFQLAAEINRHLPSGEPPVNPCEIQNFVVWGNHSPTMYPDASHALLRGKSVRSFLPPNSMKWLTENFIPNVQHRGKAIIDAIGKSSAPSAAAACIDQLRDWALGSDNNWTSMAVLGPQGRSLYGVDPGLCFSFPTVCAGYGDFRVVEGLELGEFGNQMLQKNVDELKKERDLVRHLLP